MRCVQYVHRVRYFEALAWDQHGNDISGVFRRMSRDKRLKCILVELALFVFSNVSGDSVV